MLIFYLAILIAGLYWVSKILLPEMAKPPLEKTLPKSDSFSVSQFNTLDSRIEKLESLLVEKNKNISLLQSELKVFYIQVRESDKIKTLLEEEVHRLKEQNRIFRSELGIPPIASFANKPLVPENSSAKP